MSQPIWNTPSGTLGSFPGSIELSVQLSADSVLPATSVSYFKISGSLPSNLTVSSSGLITGIPTGVTKDTVSTFVVRAIDNLGNFRDRTFSITISGQAIPSFTTPEGTLITTLDSVWVEFPIEYDNPDTNNVVRIELKEGILPPGLEINQAGMIRGYPEKPTTNIDSVLVNTFATETLSSNNTIKSYSTSNFIVGRPVIFTGTVLGTLVSGKTYYIKSVLDSFYFTVSETVNGPTVLLSDDTGTMDITLPSTTSNQPTIVTYQFTLRLVSLLGTDVSNYQITVINQNTPISQGGPGFIANNRTPALLNTRPRTFDVAKNDPTYYGYYYLPPMDTVIPTFNPTFDTFIGTVQSGNYFAWKAIGYDFDNSEIKYYFAGLPSGLTGDINTGWITGIPTLPSVGLQPYTFTVGVYKSSNPSVISSLFDFKFNLVNQVSDDIVWMSVSNLGTINNGTVSVLKVSAISELGLSYQLLSGSLPPNLTLSSTGEIMGYTMFQPNDYSTNSGETTFTFTVKAYSTDYPDIYSTKEFSITVKQYYTQPVETLYIKATLSLEDRNLLNQLLNNNTIFNSDYIYRPDDINFGKANSVIYEHLYGVYAHDIDSYIEAVTKNHYWRNITLGDIKTAVAKDSNGNIIYEVVYSEIVDNLVNNQNVSIPLEIKWPRPIDLGLGPWYTSITDIFTSYEKPDYYTSLTPGYAVDLYPNSLYNMRNRVAEELGQTTDSSLLPLWMTSVQENGSVLGYTQAWVICYTKPGYAKTIKENINLYWTDNFDRPYSLNLINFKIDRFSVNKSLTYNWDNNIVEPVWTGLPSATPTPDPTDSKDFYVLFPRKTILPNNSQY
jgi:hypothetical protein